MHSTTPPAAEALLTQLWQAAGLPAAALAQAELVGQDPVVPSSFRVGTVLQVSLAAAALAAARIGERRGGPRQTVQVDIADAVREGAARFLLDGRASDPWDKLSGLYPCGGADAPGWVRVHANFAHHRDGVLRLLGLPEGSATTRDQVAEALRPWSAAAFEEAAAQRGLVVAAIRPAAAWQAHPQARAVDQAPLVAVDRLADAPPRPWPALAAGDPPLRGLRVLDLTRILAGPVAGRTLAAYGADVLLVNSPQLPNIEAIADTSRGKLSAHVDLATEAGRATLAALVRDCDVFLQAYRPGALEALGFGPRDLARLRPGIVCVSLSAYGRTGPWAARRGFDSLVQSATGLNLLEAEAFGSAEPKALPLQALDYGAGFLLAFGALAALQRQREQGGAWDVHLSLAGVSHWLQRLGRVEGRGVQWPDLAPAMETTPSGFGALTAVRHAARFSHTPARWQRPSMPPGSHPPAWPPHGWG